MGYGIRGSEPGRDAPRSLNAEADRADWELVDDILRKPGEEANRALEALMNRHGPKIYQIAKFITVKCAPGTGPP